MSSPSEAGPAEPERILEENRRRDREISADDHGRRYGRHSPAGLFLRHGQERALVRLLSRRRPGQSGHLPLRGESILEVGCGRGDWLALLSGLAASPEGPEDDLAGTDLAGIDLAGIDLDPGRLEICARRFPRAELVCGDAAALPWPDGRFSLVTQATAFTSMLDRELRRAVAAEMLRVLAPGGAVLWYDFAWSNPGNPAVRGIGPRELAKLFPGCRATVLRATLAPPLARRLLGRTGRLWGLASLLEGLGLFSSHRLALLEPHPATSPEPP